MTSYRISKAAQADLLEIAQYGDKKYGIAQSNQYRDQLQLQFENLAQNPELYRECMELFPNIRICPFKPYMIVYTIKQNEVIFLRIRHQREDWL